MEANEKSLLIQDDLHTDVSEQLTYFSLHEISTEFENKPKSLLATSLGPSWIPLGSQSSLKFDNIPWLSNGNALKPEIYGTSDIIERVTVDVSDWFYYSR